MAKINLKNFLIILIFLIGLVSYSQRPLTGQKIFKKQYPVEQINKLTNASLLVSNTLNEDIILTLRDGGRHYITHVYVRAFQEFEIEHLPVGHFVYQYHNLKRYYESPERIPIGLNERGFLDFFFSGGATKIIGFEITKEEFFKEWLFGRGGYNVFVNRPLLSRNCFFALNSFDFASRNFFLE